MPDHFSLTDEDHHIKLDIHVSFDLVIRACQLSGTSDQVNAVILIYIYQIWTQIFTNGKIFSRWTTDLVGQKVPPLPHKKIKQNNGGISYM